MNVQNFKYYSGHFRKHYLVTEIAIIFGTFESWNNVPEVLNVHVNETKKKYTFFRKIFSPSSEKLTFEKENVIF